MANSLPRIFVNIASYRDPECQATVNNLFAKAAHPARVNVGICLQIDPNTDAACLVESNIPAQTRIMLVHPKDSAGANWARGEAQKLWQGEDYVLQIDSHMRFEQGWDETLIEMLARCPSEKPVLSTYAPRYTPPNKVSRLKNEILRTRINIMGEPGSPQLLHLGHITVPTNDTERTGLYPCPFIIANFVFAKAQMFKDIPFDPYIQFWGDEITTSARLWTHGYDVFQPDKTILYHYWRRDEMLHIQPYRNTKTKESRRVFQRVRHVLGFEEAADKEAIRDLEKYGLGTARELKDLWTFAGVDWQNRRISKHAKEGRWNMPYVPLPRIFVNIASYRDPECQWTVKDLFEKAAHPERIFVGICWQFDAEEDKDCFLVSTRPEQVRIHPVDWWKAEGVCWARLMTQRLWEGEEYTLMIDAHMRFVQGWDEMMIHELAACPSQKPVLSCSPTPYTPPNKLDEKRLPTIRRARPFQPEGNIRCQGEVLDIAPPMPLNGAFIVANFVFSRSEILAEVPYDPYLYFDQEEITYAARLYTHGWDVFSSRGQFLYHYYNDPKADGGSVRKLHWRDLRQDHKDRIRFLQERGLKRFNHLTGYRESTDPDVIKELDTYGFGTVRTLAQFEEYSGVDFKNKVASEKALRALFVKDLDKYRRRPIYIPEIDAPNAPQQGQAEQPRPANVILHGSTFNPAQPRRSAQLPLPMLEPGDFIPLFDLPTTDGRMRGIEQYAGRNCGIFFLPAHSNFISTLMQHLAVIMTPQDKTAWPIFIVDSNIEEVTALKEKLRVPYPLLADSDRRVAQSFGICMSRDAFTPPAGFMLGPNLRVTSRHVGLGAVELASCMVDDIRAAYAQQRLNKDEPRVITQQAPALIVPNAFSPEFCAKLIDAFKSGHTFEGSVGSASKMLYMPDVKSRVDHIVKDPLLSEIDEKLSRCLFPEIKKVFGFEVTHREIYKIGMYDSSKGGFFKQHRDNFDPPLGYRRIAMTLHLNEDYEGGGLSFPEYGSDIYRPEKGGAIAFSCATLHEARKVTKGERYILVGFFHGEADEAYRRHYQASKGEDLKISQFVPLLRRSPDVRQSRAVYDQWQHEHVTYHKEEQKPAAGAAKPKTPRLNKGENSNKV